MRGYINLSITTTCKADVLKNVNKKSLYYVQIKKKAYNNNMKSIVNYGHSMQGPG